MRKSSLITKSTLAMLDRVKRDRVMRITLCKLLSGEINQ
jgi:hypothetical protein